MPDSPQICLALSRLLGTDDGDVYLQTGSPARSSTYLRKSDGPSNAELISLTNPAAGQYYLLVDAYAAITSASLLASLS